MGAGSDNGYDNLRRTTSDTGGRGVYDGGVNLCERSRAGKRPDANDCFAIGTQAVLVPPRGNGFGHTAHVRINAYTVTRVPADDVDVFVVCPEGRAASICKHTIGGDERDPRSYSP